MTHPRTTRRKRRLQWLWLLVPLTILGAIGWNLGARISTDAADTRFVTALRGDDSQSWLKTMTDQQLAASGQAECDSMRSGDSPQSRIDSYTTFNGAYLVNDAMRYLCPDQLSR